MKVKKTKVEQISFDGLESAKRVEIETQAELIKQKEILKHQLEMDSQKHMDAIMSNMSKSKMYGLNDNDHKDCQYRSHEQQNCCPVNDIYRSEKDNFKHSLEKGKIKIMAILLMVIIVILAVGISPSGAWYEALQTSYVETLVDIFKVCMIIFGGYLTYKLFKK